MGKRVQSICKFREKTIQGNMLENSVSVELLQQIMKKILDSSSKYYKTLYSRKVNTVQPDILEHFLGEDRIKKLSDKED